MRLALRNLLSRPVFAAVAVLSLALALGATTALLGLVDAVVHPDVGYRDPGGLFVTFAMGGDASRYRATPYERFLLLRHEARFASGVTTASLSTVTIRADTSTRDVGAAIVSPNFFELIGAQPAAGRTFVSRDGLHGDEREVVISDRLWRIIGAGRSAAVGMSLWIDGASYQVVGVMPPNFDFPWFRDLWLPVPLAAGSDGRGIPAPFIYYRLAPGATRERAAHELNAIAQRVNLEFGLRDKPMSFRVQEVGGEFAPMLYPVHFALGGAVLLVLLVACLNVAGLMRARGAAREREMAVRAALGASRVALARLVLAECGMLVLAGTIAGGLIGIWLIDGAAGFLPQQVRDLGLFAPHFSWRVFAGALFVSALAVALITILPAWQAARADPHSAIKDGATTTTRRRRRYSGLVAAEVALTMLLLFDAALLVRSASAFVRFDFGYAASPLVVARHPVYGVKGMAGRAGTEFSTSFLARASALTSVRDAATFHDLRAPGSAVTATGPRGGSVQRWLSKYRSVSPGYLRTLGVPIRRGRDFTEGDLTTGAVIVNERAAEMLWPIDDPIDGQLMLAAADSGRPYLRVVGVAADVYESRPVDEGAEVPPMVYAVDPRDTLRMRDLVVHARSDPAAAAIDLRRVVAALNPQVSDVMHIESWRRGLNDGVELARFLGALFGAFAAFGVLISAIGVYGMTSVAVAARMREFGVRIALGAQQRDIRRLVGRETLVTLLAGIGGGALVALWAARVLRFLAWGIDSARLVVPLVACEVVVLIACIAAAAPAVRRAVRSDPCDTLRSN
jgi:predicted permease